MDDIRNIIFLIKGRMDGSLDDSQKDELRKWTEESENNRQLLERVLSNKNLKQRLDFREEFDYERNWKHITAVTARGRGTKTKRRRLTIYIARYAVVAVFAAASLFAFHHIRNGMDTHHEPYVTSGYTAPCEGEIYLEFNDGTTIPLGEDREFKAVTVEGAILSEEDNTLKVNMEGEAKTSAAIGRVIVPRGRTYKVVLADGTGVWINSDSKFEFPNMFVGSTREVNLQGEAYFEVAEDKDKPFIVHAGGMEVRVLGTSFNVNGYGENVATTLVSGSVNLETPAGNFGLSPGHQGIFDGNGMNIRKVDAGKYTAWLDGVFVFDNERLEDIMETAARWYDAPVVFGDEALKELHFTCRIPKNEPFDRLLRILEGTRLVKFSITDGTVTVSAK